MNYFNKISCLPLLLFAIFLTPAFATPDGHSEWDKSSIVLSGYCGVCPNSGQSTNGAILTVCNVGAAAMAGPTTYEIFHSDSLYQNGTIQLGASGSATACKTFCDAFAGSVKLVVQQRPGHPGAGVAKASVSCQAATPTVAATATKTPQSSATFTAVPTRTRTPVSSATATKTYTPTATRTPTPSGTPIDCMGIPFGQAVVDQCGVCGGDNSTCKDCAGVPNGNAKVDACGKCNGDGKSCLGCDGVANSGKVLDACNICGGDNSTCKDCRGVPNGGAVIDLCGQCAGNSTTCLDCAGIPNGLARQDDCGVCGGTNTTCDATKICKGKLDSCGVCDGFNACLDCAGIPNGGTNIDCCGICGGDGSTCLDKCTFYDLAKDKKEIAKSLKSLLKSIKKYSRQEANCSVAKKKVAADRAKLAGKLSDQTIDLLKQFVGDRIKLCNTPFCAKSSLVDVNKSATANLKKLYKLSKASQYAAGKSCQSGPRSAGGLPSKSASDFKNGLNGINKVPGQQCVN